MSEWRQKKYAYEYEDYEDGNADGQTMAKQILEDEASGALQELIVGCWGEPYENGVQWIIDMLVENRAHFANLRKLFIGDMTYEECEVSWIEQGNYSEIWQALPDLEALTIKGSNNLVLGEIKHEHLKSLEVICGGLPSTVLNELANAHLPQLESLLLYLGVEDYGFNGSIEDVALLLNKVQFPKLTSLGIVNSELQDEVAILAMDSPYLPQLVRLDLSMGTLTDLGGQAILANQVKLNHLQMLDLTHHYLSKELMSQLQALPFTVILDGAEAQNSSWRCPMLTE